MKDPLGVSPSIKGNQGTARGKEKILLTWVEIETTTSGLNLLLDVRLGYICIHSAAQHSIRMYPYFLFAAIHHLNRSRRSLSDLVHVAQSAE